MKQNRIEEAGGQVYEITYIQAVDSCRAAMFGSLEEYEKRFRKPAAFVCLGGILLFGSVFIKTYFTFMSFWASHDAGVVILCILTTSVTTLCTFLLLNAEG